MGIWDLAVPVFMRVFLLVL